MQIRHGAPPAEDFLDFFWRDVSILQEKKSLKLRVLMLIDFRIVTLHIKSLFIDFRMDLA
jgi:hypothetical protein